MQLAHAHGELAVVGFEQRAFCAENVAHVPMFECVVCLFAHALIVDIKLDLAGNVLQGGEAGFAHGAFEHHAAGHFNGNFLRVELGFFERAVLRLQIAGKGVAAEIVGKGDTVLADFVQFFTAQSNDLVFVELSLFGLRSVLVCHFGIR